MPGFSIGNPDGPSATVETYREHRYRLVQFFDVAVSDDSAFIYLKEVTIPEKSLDILSIKTPGTTYNFAKSAKYSDLKLVFYATDKFISQVYNLEEQFHTIDEGIKDFDLYKGDIVWHLFDDGLGNIENSIRYNAKGCLVSRVGWGQLSYESSSIKQVEVEVKVDYLTVE